MDSVPGQPKIDPSLLESGAKAVRWHEGTLSMWSARLGIKIASIATYFYKNENEVTSKIMDSTKSTFEAFTTGDYRTAIGNLNHMNKEQLAAFSARLNNKGNEVLKEKIEALLRTDEDGNFQGFVKENNGKTEITKLKDNLNPRDKNYPPLKALTWRQAQSADMGNLKSVAESMHAFTKEDKRTISVLFLKFQNNLESKEIADTALNKFAHTISGLTNGQKNECYEMVVTGRRSAGAHLVNPISDTIKDSALDLHTKLVNAGEGLSKAKNDLMAKASPTGNALGARNISQRPGTSDPITTKVTATISQSTKPSHKPPTAQEIMLEKLWPATSNAIPDLNASFLADLNTFEKQGNNEKLSDVKKKQLFTTLHAAVILGDPEILGHSIPLSKETERIIRNLHIAITNLRKELEANKEDDISALESSINLLLYKGIVPESIQSADTAAIDQTIKASLDSAVIIDAIANKFMESIYPKIKDLPEDLLKDVCFVAATGDNQAHKLEGDNLKIANEFNAFIKESYVSGKFNSDDLLSKLHRLISLENEGNFVKPRMTSEQFAAREEILRTLRLKN